MLYRFLANLTVVIHLAFIEFTGRICPLTPLENLVRRRAGQTSLRRCARRNCGILAVFLLHNGVRSGPAKETSFPGCDRRVWNKKGRHLCEFDRHPCPFECWSVQRITNHAKPMFGQISHGLFDICGGCRLCGGWSVVHCKTPQPCAAEHLFTG